MSNLQLPQTYQNEAVLGSEYCSGYFDSLKNWNNGFYCPSVEDSIDVFCCGSSTHKYCCTKKDQVIQEEVESVTILIGIVVGASTALLLLTIVGCVCCSWCPLYTKKSHHKNRGGPASVYRLEPGGSEHSAVTNMYSMSTPASRSTTPLPQHMMHSEAIASSRDNLHLVNTGMSHSYTLPHSMSHHHGLRSGSVNNSRREMVERRYGTLGRQPKEQPPPYHILPRSSYLLIPQDTPDLLSGGPLEKVGVTFQGLDDDDKIVKDQEVVEGLHHQQDDEEEDLYHSTKF